MGRARHLLRGLIHSLFSGLNTDPLTEPLVPRGTESQSPQPTQGTCPLCRPLCSRKCHWPPPENRALQAGAARGHLGPSCVCSKGSCDSKTCP